MTMKSNAQNDPARSINSLGAIQMVAPVIANPQGEAIQCTRMDCFTPIAMTGEGDRKSVG
jgi:hypothetical protein